MSTATTIRQAEGTYRVAQLTGAFGLDNVEFGTRQVQRPGPREVLVRIRAASLNYRDLLVLKGAYYPELPLPRIPLSDGAGEVVEIGSEVASLKVGDRVVAAFMPQWVDGPLRPEYGDTALGGLVDGMLAEQIVLPETALVPLPDYLSFAEAATLPCAAVTAWHSLVIQGGLRAGQTVLVQGTGGVSLFALQIAKVHGARTILISSSDEKRKKAEALGGNLTLNYREEANWGARIYQQTGGVDHVIEVGGPGSFKQSADAVKTGGHIGLIGLLGGAEGSFGVLPLLLKQVKLEGVFVGSVAMLRELTGVFHQHRIKPVIDRVFPFQESPHAFKYLESASHFGKVVIDFEG